MRSKRAQFRDLPANEFSTIGRAVHRERVSQLASLQNPRRQPQPRSQRTALARRMRDGGLDRDGGAASSADWLLEKKEFCFSVGTPHT